MLTKRQIIEALYTFAHQRPGLDWRNYYSDWRDKAGISAYRSEVRSIGKDLQHARDLLRAVELRDSITADDLIRASQSAFSGRLTITERDGKAGADYCTGQYWPTEYRRAVCAVLAAALWAYWRADMPEPTLHHDSETGEGVKRYRGMRAGDYLRHTAKRELGVSIARRWFA